MNQLPELNPFELVPMTPRQKEILEFIRNKIANRGFAPSIREIGEAFAISSPNGVMCHLKALEKKGLIERNKGIGDAKSAARSITIPSMKKASATFPMLGTVAAGTALEAVAQPEEYIDVGEMLGGREHYALLVRGSSMIDDMIDEGDYVIIKKQETADNGDRVIVMIEGQATLKRFYRRKGQIILEPANSSMNPIILDSTKDIKLLGILIGVVRKC